VSRQSPYGGALHPACLAAVDHAAALCTSLGHEIVDDEPEYDFPSLARAMFKVVMATRTAGSVGQQEKALAREVGSDEIEPYTRAMVELGRTLGALDYAAALDTIDGFSRRFAAFFLDCDVLLTPTLARPPLPLGELIGSIADADIYLDILFGFMPFTMQFNASGLPAISLPLHWTGEGLPIGVQFGGRHGEDARLLRLAGQLEQASPWFKRRPRIADSIG